MAAAAARAVQAVRSHVRLIQFPQRNVKDPPAAAAATSPVTASSSPSSPSPAVTASATPAQPQTTVPVTYAKPVGNIPRGAGIDSQNLPPKYRRRLIDEIEIDYIDRGGPE